MRLVEPTSAAAAAASAALTAATVVARSTSNTQSVSEALASLGRSCQELLRLLAEDPPPSYQAISAALGMPVPSIGPTRQRCLRNLARHPRIVSITGRVPGSFTAGASDQHEGGAR